MLIDVDADAVNIVMKRQLVIWLTVKFIEKRFGNISCLQCGAMAIGRLRLTQTICFLQRTMSWMN